MSTTSRAIDTIIEKHSRRLELLRQIRDLVEQDAGIAHELVEALSQEAVSSTNGSGGATQFEMVKRFFVKNNNPWATAKEIEAGAGIARGGVAYVLYKSKSDEFEKRSHPDRPRVQQWRLRGGTPDLRMFA